MTQTPRFKVGQYVTMPKHPRFGAGIIVGVKTADILINAFSVTPVIDYDIEWFDGSGLSKGMPEFALELV